MQVRAKRKEGNQRMGTAAGCRQGWCVAAGIMA